MGDFINDITSTYWWLILIVGLLVGILGNFLSEGIKKLYGSVSSGQRERNIEKEKEREEEIEYLVNSPEVIIDYQFLATRADLHSTRNFVITFIILFASFPREGTPPIIQYTLLFLAGFPYYVSLRAAFERNRFTDISNEARRRLQEKKKEGGETIPF